MNTRYFSAILRQFLNLALIGLLASTMQATLSARAAGLPASPALDPQASPALVSPDSRVDTILASGWIFHKGDVSGGQSTGLNESSFNSVVMPNDWNAIDAETGGDNNYYRGIGWYRLHTTIPASAAGKQIFLRFEAVGITATVYVNGTQVCIHEGGFAAFDCDITNIVTAGASTLVAVKVDNSSTLDVAPLGGDFSVDGGIYRPVHLVVMDKVHITPMDMGSPGVYLTPTNVTVASANLAVRTIVDNSSTTSQSVTVQTTIKDASGTVVATLTPTTQTIAASGNSTFIQSITINNPHLWNGRLDPYLYSAVVDVMLSGVIVDEVVQPLGFRSFTVSKTTGFSLNGQPYDLHGVAMHEGWLDKGHAISDANRLQDIQMLLSMGTTAIRLAHYQHSDYIYTLADQNGLVLWTEVPMVNSISGTQHFSDNAKQQLQELIRQNYNHPSVFFWGLYNELAPIASDIPFIQMMSDLAHTEDSTRLTTGADFDGAVDGVTVIPTDLIAGNIYQGWYQGAFTDMTSMVNTANAIPSYKVGISEYGAGASINQHEENPAMPIAAGTWHPEEYQNLFHESYWQQIKSLPYLWFKTVWVAFDFASDARDEGDTFSRNDKGLITIDRSVKKDAYFWYQANWTTTPFVYITSRTYTPRDNLVVPVKVYSNCNPVTLTVNGASLGPVTSTNHIYQWNSVVLQANSNTIQATCSSQTDSVTWNTGPQLTPLPIGLYQETDSRIVYTPNTAGTWTSDTEAGPNGGSTLVTSQQGAVAKFDFQGVGLNLYRTMNSDRGTIQVCVDGACQTVNNNNATLLWNQKVAIVSGLTNTVHRAVIRNVPGSTMDVDAVEVIGPPDVPTLASPANGATGLTDSTPAFDWGDVATATQYQIQIATNSSFTSPVVDATTTTSSYSPATGLSNGTYFWHVRASNGFFSSYSSPWTFTLSAPANQPPTAPVISSPSNNATSVGLPVTLSWSASTDPDNGDPLTYKVFLGTSPSPTTVVCTTATTSCPAGTLLDGQAYFWQVQVNDGNSHTVNSSQAQFTTNRPPTTPVISSPINNATGITSTPTLSWTASTDPDAGDTLTYTVLLGTSPGPTATLCTTTTTSCPAGTLADGQTYYWSVRVSDGKGHTVSSSEVHFTTNFAPNVPVISAPINNATGVGSPVTLSWTGSDPDAGDTLTYTVFFGTAPGPTTTLCTTTTTSCSAGTLADGQTYYWSVQVNDGMGHTVPSIEAHFLTNRPPTAPVISSPSNNATGVGLPATLSWAALTDPDAGDTLTYTVFLGTAPSPSTTACTTTTTSCPAGTLADGQIYYWSVQVSDGKGHTVNSNPAQFTTNYPPTAPVISAPSNGATGVGLPVTLSWTASTDPDAGDTLTYKVFFGTTSGPTATLCTTTTTSCPAGTLANGQTYYWSVQVGDGKGHTVSSPEASFMTNRAPNAPVNTSPASAATGVPSAPTLSWTGSDPDAGDTLTYDVYLSTTNPPPLSSPVCNDTGSTSCSVNGLSFLTTYYWKVVATDSHGLSTAGVATSFTTMPPPPAVSLNPSGLSFDSIVTGAAGAAQSVTVTNTGPGTLNISGITPSADFTVTNGTCGSSVASGASCSFEVTFAPASPGLKNQSVQIVSNAPSSPDNLGVSGTALAAITPPLLVAAKNGAAVYTPHLSLTWKGIKGATGYHIEISTNSHFSGTPTQSGDPASPNFPTQDLAFGTYYWHVATKNASDQGGYSLPFSFDVTLNKTPAKNSATSARLAKYAWLAVKGATSYHLKVYDNLSDCTDETGSVTPRLDKEVAKPTYAMKSPDDTPLDLGSYYWHVQADAGVTTSWTPCWRFDVTTLKSPKNGSPTTSFLPMFSWTANKVATGYQINFFHVPDGGAPAFMFSRPTTKPTYPAVAGDGFGYGHYQWNIQEIVIGLGSSTPSFDLYITIMAKPANNTFTTDTTPVFSWKAIKGETDYVLQIADDPAFTLNVRSFDALAKTTYTLKPTEALRQGQYYWRVVASGPASYTMPGWAFTVGP